MYWHITEVSTDSIDVLQLQEELSAVSGYSHIMTGSGIVEVIFDEEPSQQVLDETDAILTDHVPGALNVKLYRYIETQKVDKRRPPFDIDYDTGIATRLHPHISSMVFGEVREIMYYASASMDGSGNITYSDPVIKESYAYTRDSVGFARSRTLTIGWYLENGEIHSDTKERVKYYDHEESLREGQRRRGNIIDKLAMELGGILLATQTQLTNPQDRLALGRAFMKHHKTNMDMFITASSPDVLYSVNDDTDPEHEWLDDMVSATATIRQYLISSMNIWGLTV